MSRHVGKYPYYISELHPFHESMRELGIHVGTFSFRFNRVQSRAIFRVDLSPYRIMFAKPLTEDVFEAELLYGYKMLLSAEDDCRIRDFFNIPQGYIGNRAVLTEFAEALRKQIPNSLDKNSLSKQRAYVARILNVEEPGKPYFWYFKNWEEINARVGHKVGTRSEENWLKTEALYPKINAFIGKRDVSVCYTSDPAKESRLEVLSFN